jgi:hypothetical protein
MSDKCEPSRKERKGCRRTGCRPWNCYCRPDRTKHDLAAQEEHEMRDEALTPAMVLGYDKTCDICKAGGWGHTCPGCGDDTGHREDNIASPCVKCDPLAGCYICGRLWAPGSGKVLELSRCIWCKP